MSLRENIGFLLRCPKFRPLLLAILVASWVTFARVVSGIHLFDKLITSGGTNQRLTGPTRRSLSGRGSCTLGCGRDVAQFPDGLPQYAGRGHEKEAGDD